MKAGFVGLGLMGLGMATNLIKKGVTVKGYDIMPEAVNRLVQAGGVAAASPADAADGADIIFTMLPNSPHVEEALFGENGITKTMSKKALYVDSSTIPPGATVSLAKRLKEKGLSMIDSAVGRSSVEAALGKLVFMVGGSEEDLKQARPYLDMMGDTIIHCGPIGSGIKAKIVNNYMTTALIVLTAETLALAEAFDLDLNIATEVMKGTPAGRTQLLTSFPNKVLKGDVAPGFMIDLADKDLGIALDEASKARLPLPTGAAAKQMYALSSAQGRGREDWTAMLLTYRDLMKKK